MTAARSRDGYPPDGSVVRRRDIIIHSRPTSGESFGKSRCRRPRSRSHRGRRRRFSSCSDRLRLLFTRTRRHVVRPDRTTTRPRGDRLRRVTDAGRRTLIAVEDTYRAARVRSTRVSNFFRKSCCKLQNACRVLNTAARRPTDINIITRENVDFYVNIVLIIFNARN